jgi:hypothetical protein
MNIHACFAMLVVVVALVGCKAEERVVKYKPFLSGIPGASHKVAAVDETGDAERLSQRDPFAGGEPQTEDERQGKIVIEHPDGSKTLVLTSIRHMMTHLERTLDDDEDDLLIDQVIAPSTTQHYALEGRDIEELVAFLKKRRRDIAVLFSRMPFAERTATVIMDKQGRNLFRLRLTGQAKKDTRFTELWTEFEKGQWKFVWVR